MWGTVRNRIMIGLTFLLGSLYVHGQTFEEVNGIIAVEAENYHKQTNSDIRKWYKVSTDEVPEVLPDPDTSHAATASKGAYLELLPDTRVTHDDPLEVGVNITNTPGEMAVLYYNVYFNNPGKYYVWVRTFSSGTEDNGLHVGLDGKWPESGQRMQFGGNQQDWAWGSRQRTEEVHTGVPGMIFLKIEKAGLHTISFSMREDGFEFDKWMMSREYKEPQGSGPEERIYAGK